LFLADETVLSRSITKLLREPDWNDDWKKLASTRKSMSHMYVYRIAQVALELGHLNCVKLLTHLRPENVCLDHVMARTKCYEYRRECVKTPDELYTLKCGNNPTSSTYGTLISRLNGWSQYGPHIVSAVVYAVACFVEQLWSLLKLHTHPDGFERDVGTLL